jgi:hypothetical protein
MTTTRKILLSIGALAGYDLACRVLTPPAQLASSPLVVQQMDGSNASALAAHMVGSAGWVPQLLLLAALALALGLVWGRKAR